MPLGGILDSCNCYFFVYYFKNTGSILLYTGLLVECGKKWKIVRKILPNSAGNSAEKSEIVRENAK